MLGYLRKVAGKQLDWERRKLGSIATLLKPAVKLILLINLCEAQWTS